MKNFFIIISIFFLISCEKITDLNRVVINAIHIKDINLTDQDITNNNTLNYFYSKNLLYISDNLHKKVFALNSYNRVVFELGNIFDTSTQRQNESGAWDSILEEMQTEFNTSKPAINKNVQNLEKNTNTAIVKQNYTFENIGKIAVDNENNLYIVHTFKDKNTQNNHLELLKFSSTGSFLYRIGEEGRDNPAFSSDIQIQNFYFDVDNGMWVKYLKDGKLCLRYYSNFGKNILFYTEENITPVIESFLDQNQGDKKYTIEDIFPVNNTRNIMVILDIYNEQDGQLNIQKKQIITLNQKYIVDDIISIKNLNMQIYGITNDNKLYGLTYQNKDGYLLEIYELDGNNIMKTKINPDIHYYNRLSLGVNPEGGLLGIFLKSKDLVFVTWR